MTQEIQKTKDQKEALKKMQYTPFKTLSSLSDTSTFDHYNDLLAPYNLKAHTAYNGLVSGEVPEKTETQKM